MIKIVGTTSRLNSGELKVLDWIKTADVKKQFTVLVEPSYKCKKAKHARWPDFVLISRKFGVYILECKSHNENNVLSVNDTEGLVLNGSIDRYQSQLRDYFYLIKALTKDLDFDVPISKGAVFPNISQNGPVAEAIRNHHYDNGDLFFKEDLLFNFQYSHQDDLMTTEQFNDLCRALNKESVIEHNYGVDKDEIKRRIYKFSQEQVEKINRVQDGNYVFNGLPGTGKTKMLVAIARREEAKEKRVGYICFNRPLRDSVAQDLSEDMVFTTNQIIYKLCKHFFLPFDLYNQEVMQSSIESLIAMHFEPMFDVLLIDEYQDLDEEDYKILLKCIIPNGLIVLAGDPLQEIKGKEVTWKSRGIHVYGTQSMFLGCPYRTEASIVDFGLKFLATSKELSKIIDKYFIDHNFYYSFNDTKDGVRNNLHFWLHDKATFKQKLSRIVTDNPNFEILVITNSKYQQAELELTSTNNVRVEPYTRVKGLEADIVLIYNLDSYLDSDNRTNNETKMRSLFSALCRSRGKVIIHGEESKGLYKQLQELAQDYLDEAETSFWGKIKLKFKG